VLRVRRFGLVGVLVLGLTVVSGGVALAAPGDISTIAGTGTGGYNGDGIAATSAKLAIPFGVAVDAAGNVFIGDAGNARVRRVDATTGVITTIAGTGTAGYNGDGIAATSAKLDAPWGVAVDAAGNVFIGDANNHRVRRVDATTGLITTIAGTGTAGYNGDGIVATSAELDTPTGVAVDAAGNVFIADDNGHRVRRVDATTGLISTLAGTGTAGYNGDGVAGTSAKLNGPSGVAVDAAGNVFIADVNNHRVRRVDAGTGLISTIAGTGAFGYSGNGGAATSAKLNTPYGVSVDAVGNVFIADTGNLRVRRVDSATGLISTIAGNGTVGSSGNGGTATSAQLAGPTGVAVDAAGNVLIADAENHQIREIEALVCWGQQATLIGTSGADVLTGTPGNDVIMGFGGADTIYGLGGADLICSGDGPDVVHGNGGKDRIDGGDGDDTIYGDTNNDRILAGNGDDTIYGDAGNDRLFGGNGDDTLRGNAGVRDRLYGGAGVDDLDGGTGGDDHCTTGEAYTFCEVIF